MEKRNAFRAPPPPPLTPDQAVVQSNCETLERELIFGMVRSCWFYRNARDLVCPYDAEKRKHRPDFTIDRYNTLYRALDGWYRRFDTWPLPNDMVIPPNTLAAYIIDWGNKNQVDIEVVLKLAEEIKDEAALTAEITYESSMALLESPGFKHWREQRLLEFAHAKIHAQRTLGVLTLANLEETMRQTSLAVQQGQKSNFLNAGYLLRSTRRFGSALLSDLPDLDTALGGGFRRGTGSLIAGINGGGKTILMCQLAKAFALNNNRVALFTTEQPPHVMVTRMVAAHLNVKIDEFWNRPELKALPQGQSADLSMLPDWVWTDPRTSENLHRLEETITNNILFVDWAQGQGYSIEKHLDSEVEKMLALGWNPDAILFDWIGGGLEKVADKSQLRHTYQAGIDHLINSQAKQHDRVVIAAAQLDKNQVKPETGYVEMRMLSECKGMTNLVSNFIGLTALRGKNENEKRLKTTQFMTVDKSTGGPGGNVQVEQRFEFQKFIGIKRHLINADTK